MAKATREAKQQTGWLRPDAAYDAAVEKFVREMLAHPPFVAQARAVAEAIASHGLVNGLAQLCLKLAAPGVPDIYQGSELLNFSLVDPDNRRPVDYALRRRLLAGLAHAAPGDLLASPHDGRLKLLVTRRGLGHRRAHRDFYLSADYEPLAGDRHLVAFRRRLGARELVCVVPRLTYTLTGGRRPWPLADAWAEQELDLGDPAPRVDLLTGAVHSAARLRLAEVFAALPVALLWRADP
jgi:(1->4)-alpha-D-glucan 1-alpha-D-glucosylmutase